MTNDDDMKNLGPLGTFKVKLKSPGDDAKYLKRGSDGTLKWDATGTDLCRDIERDLPGLWYVVDGSGNNKFLSVKGDEILWSGASRDEQWEFSDDRLSHGAAGYFKYEVGDDRPTLTKHREDATELELSGAIRRSRLNAGDTLIRGQELTSPDGRFYAPLQRDGNFVVYRKPMPPDGSWVWDMNKRGGARLVMQPEGNLVLYPHQGAALWESGTRDGSYAVLQVDGNLVVYDRNNKARWSHMTGRLP